MCISFAGVPERRHVMFPHINDKYFGKSICSASNLCVNVGSKSFLSEPHVKEMVLIEFQVVSSADVHVGFEAVVDAHLGGEFPNGRRLGQRQRDGERKMREVKNVVSFVAPRRLVAVGSRILGERVAPLESEQLMRGS